MRYILKPMVAQTLLLLGVGALLILGDAACRSQPREQTATESQGPKTEAKLDKTGDLVTCPVCGLSFPKSDAVASEMYKGKRYYFYLEDHHKAFLADPESYVPKASAHK